jgi:ubiquinone/menaquinone biosynthesis C-methylase UbiE
VIRAEVYDRDYYLSELCEGYEYFLDGHGVSPLKQRELALLEPLSGARVLDAGCGRGEVLAACARAGAASVTGVDSSSAAVEIAREVVAGEVLQADIARLPLPDASFDRVLMGDVIEHLDSDQAAAALAEARRVLAPGGRLVLHTAPNRRFTRLWPLLRHGVPRATREHMDEWLALSPRYHPNEQTPGSLRRALRDASFTRARVWVDPDLLRGGTHHLTASMSGAPVAAAAAAGRLRVVRALLGNDIYAVAER